MRKARIALDLLVWNSHNGCMLTLPPSELPTLQTHNLVVPRSRWLLSLDWLRHPEKLTLPQRDWNTSPVFGFALGTTTATIVATALFFTVLQPRTPGLSDDLRSELTQEIAAARAPSSFLADASAAELPEVIPSPSPVAIPSLESAPVAAELASSAPPVGSPTEKVYAYQLALSQGFLKKAVDLSQQSRNSQTENQRNAILQSLDQALSAANKAIELDAAQGAGFLVRARIYKTAATLKPELNTNSEQDLIIARALGVNAHLLGTDTSILEFLPTQQATELASAPIIADAEEGNATTVSGSSTGNTAQGRITLAAGQTTLAVSYPALKATQSLRIDVVNRAQNSGNALFSVVNRVDGQGFSIQSSKPLENNIELEWRAIHE